MKTKKAVILVVALLNVAVIIFAVVKFVVLPEFYSDDNINEKHIVVNENIEDGIRLVYQASNKSGGELVKKDMEDAVDILYARLENLGFTEAFISVDEEVIQLEIPSADNAEEIIEMIGSTAELQFVNADGAVVLDSGDIKDAAAGYDEQEDGGFTSYHYITLTLKDSAVSKWAEATAAAAARPEGENYISIMLDGVVFSSPRVQERIDTNTCTITGNFTKEEASELAAVIKAGALPVKLELYEMEKID